MKLLTIYSWHQNFLSMSCEFFDIRYHACYWLRSHHELSTYRFHPFNTLIIWMSRTMQQLWTGCKYSIFCNFCENRLYNLEEMNSVLTNWSSNWILSINFNTFRRKSDWIIEYPFQPTQGFWIFLITIFLFWREKV